MQFRATSTATGVDASDFKVTGHESERKGRAYMVLSTVQNRVFHFARTPMGKIRVRDAQVRNEAAFRELIPFFQQENGHVR
jgi:hypothetical protein